MSQQRLYTNNIPETQCIGDSLNTINTNFQNVDFRIQDIDGLLTSIPSLMNIRISPSSTQSVVTQSVATTTLYIHPYKGDVVFLYNTTKQIWELKRVTSIIPVSLAGLQPSTNYDVYLSFNNGTNTFNVNFVSWGNNNPGAVPPALNTSNGPRLLNGVLVNNNNNAQRLIGCLRTTGTGQTEINLGTIARPGGSNPQIFIWNLYNPEPIAFSIIDSGASELSPTPGSDGLRTWSAPAVGGTQEFIPYGGTGNRVSFITRNPQVVSMTSLFRLAATPNNAIAAYYFTYSLNVVTPQSADIMRETPGMIIHEQQGRAGDGGTQGFSNVIKPGYHFIQLVHRSGAGLVHYVYTGERHSEGTTGTVSSF
jgi:hypothetical protein